MCRSIKVLNSKENTATHQDIHDASLQYVRKISGMRKPSKANKKAFESSIKEISKSSEKLLDSLN